MKTMHFFTYSNYYPINVRISGTQGDQIFKLQYDNSTDPKIISIKQ